MTTADNQPLGQALAENQAFLQTMFGGSSDFYTKSFTICGCRCCIAMFAGLSSPEKLCIMVLHALGQGVPGCKAGPQLVQYLAEQSCLPTEQTPITTRTQLVEALAGGMAVLLVEGSGQALAFSTQDMPGRSVTNPSGEGNMRGPQDAFTEHLRNNISQLRRQFRTGSFTAEICTANTRAKTEYAICYDTALAPADVVQTLKQRLAGVQIPVLLDSTYFASFLKQDKLNLFPAAAYTERPATACARICEGKIVILVSGSPLAMVVPSFFAEHFECLDDYSSGAVFAGLIRLLKYLAFLLAVFGPGLYVMAVSFAPELIPVHLLAKLAQGEASTPLPPMPEMLAVTLLLEIVREAGLRAPKSISHTVSLVGALIIGETAVSAGIISVPVLTMAAAATIATLAVPALYEQSILFR
ncbi:MAG: spore germination protein, partial [Gemmiger qucibialis]